MEINTKKRKLTIPEIIPILHEIDDLLCNEIEITEKDNKDKWNDIADIVETLKSIYEENWMFKRF